MPTRLFLNINLCALALAANAGDFPALLAVPTLQQVAWHEAGVGLLFHWAPNV